MGAWDAFVEGLWRAGRRWQPLAALYLVNFALAGLLALLPAATLVRPGFFTAIEEAAQGIPFWLLVELVMPTDVLAGAPGDLYGTLVMAALLQAALLFFGLPAAAWISSALVSGGVLLVFIEHDRPFTWRRFWWGSWRWLGAFLLLGALQHLVTLLILLPAVWGMSYLLVSGRQVEATLIGVALALLAVPWLGWMEGARFFAVRDGTQNIFKALGLAAKYNISHALSLSVYYLLSLGLLLGVHAIYRLGVLPLTPPGFLPLALLAQQSFIVMRLYLRAARWAGWAALQEPDPALAQVSAAPDPFSRVDVL